jgi:hypothetical protein
MDNLDSILGTGGTTSPSASTGNPAAGRAAVADRLTGRYTDAYRVARFLVALGTVLKWIGIAVPALLILLLLARLGS